MSILNHIFNAYPMLVENNPDALSNPVTDGSGRYMEAGVALKCLVYPIDADPATLHLVSLKLGGSPTTPILPQQPQQQPLFPTLAKQLQQDLVVNSPSKTEATPAPSPTILEPEERPQTPDLEPLFSDAADLEAAPIPNDDDIPAVSMQPFLDEGYEKVNNLQWVDRLTRIDNPAESPLYDAYSHIEHKILVGFVIHLAPPSTESTGIYSETSIGGAYQCYGAIVIGPQQPNASLMPSASTGPVLRARLFDMEDGSPVMFHIMHRVEVVSAIRRTTLFQSFANSVSSEQQERVNARVQASKNAQEDKLGEILNDPTMIKALFAKLMQDGGAN